MDAGMDCHEKIRAGKKSAPFCYDKIQKIMEKDKASYKTKKTEEIPFRMNLKQR